MTRESFTEFVQDQLVSLERVTMRAMFGGHGLYVRERFFGIVFHGRLYFKTDSASRPAYQARGMRPFRPRATQVLKTYYEVPAEILEDAEELTRWAEVAIACRRSVDSPAASLRTPAAGSRGWRPRPRPGASGSWPRHSERSRGRDGHDGTTGAPAQPVPGRAVPGAP